MPAVTLIATASSESANGVALVSGGNQDGRVGSPLKKPVVAKLVDKNGNPVAGATVRVVAKTGTVADTMPAANAVGEVHIVWTLGTKAGIQTLDIVPASGSTIRTTARALPLEPANVTPSTVPATAPAGRPLIKPITVTVTDAYGNIIPDVQVLFSVSAGITAPVRVMTDAKGQAATHWTLGPAAGEQTLTASVRATTVKSKLTVLAAGKTPPAAVKPPKAVEKKAPETGTKRPTTSRAEVKRRSGTVLISV
jgi:adhesin/invasin